MREDSGSSSSSIWKDKEVWREIDDGKPKAVCRPGIPLPPAAPAGAPSLPAIRPGGAWAPPVQVPCLATSFGLYKGYVRSHCCDHHDDHHHHS